MNDISNYVRFTENRVSHSNPKMNKKEHSFLRRFGKELNTNFQWHSIIHTLPECFHMKLKQNYAPYINARRLFIKEPM